MVLVWKLCASIRQQSFFFSFLVFLRFIATITIIICAYWGLNIFREKACGVQRTGKKDKKKQQLKNQSIKNLWHLSEIFCLRLTGKCSLVASQLFLQIACLASFQVDFEGYIGRCQKCCLAQEHTQKRKEILGKALFCKTYLLFY